MSGTALRRIAHFHHANAQPLLTLPATSEVNEFVYTADGRSLWLTKETGVLQVRDAADADGPTGAAASSSGPSRRRVADAG